MSHRGGRRRGRGVPLLREAGPTLLCPRCRVQVARTKPSELGPEKELGYLVPKLDGTGWDLRDGVWHQSSHGKAHVKEGDPERGVTPHPTRARGWARSVSWNMGPDPATGENLVWGHQTQEFKGIARDGHLDEDTRVECPRCGAEARWERGRTALG